MSNRSSKNKPTILTIPKDLEWYENRTSIYWLDEKGVVYSISKWTDPMTLDESKEAVEEFLDRFGHKKYCLVMDITNSPPSNKETRDMAAHLFPKITTALAILSNTPLGNMMANLFIGLKPPSYPMKLFSEEEKAREWVEKFL